MIIKMNVAFIIDYYPPNHDGGDSIFARDLAIGMKNSVNPIIFTRIPEISATYEFKDAGVRVAYLGNDWKTEIFKYLDDIDLIHFFQIDNLPVVQTIKGKKNVPTLFHMEISFLRYSEMFEPDYDTKVYHPLERKAIEMSDKVIVPCDKELGEIARVYPLTNLVAIPNGINYSLRLNQPLEPSLTDRRNFAFMGRLDDPMKGGDVLIEAISNLSKAYLDNAHFKFVGTRDTRFLDQLDAMDKPFQYEVHPWISDQSKLWDILADVHFMLIPSKYETFGMVCLEAMAMGIIPIVSDAGAMGEMVEHGLNGIFIGEHNQQMPKRLSDVIVNSVEISYSQYLDMRNAAIDTARNQYNIEKIVEQIIPIYNKMRGTLNE